MCRREPPFSGHERGDEARKSVVAKPPKFEVDFLVPDFHFLCLKGSTSIVLCLRYRFHSVFGEV